MKLWKFLIIGEEMCMTPNFKLFMKGLVVFALIFISIDVFAKPYVEYKNEYSLKEWKHTKTTNHLRVGYKAENNLYFEVGPMTEGHSYEAGYKFKFNALTFKGKVETKDAGISDTKVETEVRLNF